MNAVQIVTTTEVTDALCDGSQDKAVVVSATGGAGSFNTVLMEMISVIQLSLMVFTLVSTLSMYRT